MKRKFTLKNRKKPETIRSTLSWGGGRLYPYRVRVSVKTSLGASSSVAADPIPQATRWLIKTAELQYYSRALTS